MNSTPDARAGASASDPQRPIRGALGSVAARIDGAHELQTVSARSAAQQPESAEPAIVHERATDATQWPRLTEELQRQARQLQGHLKQRLAEVDRREAQVNAHAAALEEQARGARLWLREQHALLDVREERAVLRDEDVTERQSQVAAAEAYLESQRKETAERQSRFQQELDRRAAELSAQREQLKLADQAAEQSPRGMASGKDQNLLAKRRQLAIRLRRARARIVEQARAWGAKLRKRESHLEERSRELASRHADLEQLRLSLLSKHTELLELRLTIEQLMAEYGLSEGTPQATSALSTTRTKIAEQYQQTRSDLAAQQEALESLRAEIATRYEELADRRDAVINLARRRRLLEARKAAEALLRRAG